MILASAPDGLRFVTQPVHAELAGTFAERWGGEGFERPAPSPAVRIAVHTHDDGWWSYDRRPRLNADGTPVDFHEVPPSQWRRLYREGIDRVARVDYYAGLLVSMHGSGLRRRRYGLSPSWGETPRAFRGFVTREERRQRSLATALRESEADDRLSAADSTLLDRLHEAGGPPERGTTDAVHDDSRLWFNYRLLQALDALSLRICATVVDDPETADPIEVERVPTARSAPDATLTAEPVGAGTYRLDPYPFRDSPVTVRLPTRTVARDEFTSGSELVAAYYEADREETTFTLRADAR